MKHFLTLLTATALILSMAACGGKESASDNDKDTTVQKKAEKVKMYSVEKGMTESKVTNNLDVPGVITNYWKDYGSVMYSRTVKKTKDGVNESVVLIDGDVVYSWDTGTKQGFKMEIDAQTEENLNFNNITDEQIKKYNIKKEGTEEFFGKPCDIFTMNYEGATMKTWVWKGIVLKSDNRMDDAVFSSEVVKMEVDVDAPAGTFEVPADINIEALPKTAR